MDHSVYLVFYETTDVIFATKPLKTKHWKAIKLITPNEFELKIIAEKLGLVEKDYEIKSLQEMAVVAKNITNFIDNVIVTLGSNGILVARKSGPENGFLEKNSLIDAQVRHYPVKKIQDVVNVSGAGDCLASGLIAAMLKGLSEDKSVTIGFEAAALALRSPLTVGDLTKIDFSHVKPSVYNEILC